MLTQIIDDGKKQNRYIDRTYIGEVKARKRMNRISEINDMLLKMTNTQIENVHRYTVDGITLSMKKEMIRQISIRDQRDISYMTSMMR